LLGSETDHLLKTYRFEESDKPDAIGMSCGGNADVFLEAHLDSEELLIFGGGHIGQALSALAMPLNFRITVVDDREEILNEFSLPVRTTLVEPGFSTDLPEAGKNSHVVIVTKGHKGDLTVLQEIIRRECAYIGMIGSKAKIAQIFAALRQQGIDQKSLDRVHSPIGLDIGAEGPHEIAISIMAEIINAKKKSRQRTS